MICSTFNTLRDAAYRKIGLFLCNVCTIADCQALRVEKLPAPRIVQAQGVMRDITFQATPQGILKLRLVLAAPVNDFKSRSNQLRTASSLNTRSTP
jgi:hypothetical protein